MRAGGVVLYVCRLSDLAGSGSSGNAAPSMDSVAHDEKKAAQKLTLDAGALVSPPGWACCAGAGAEAHFAAPHGAPPHSIHDSSIINQSITPRLAVATTEAGRLQTGDEASSCLWGAGDSAGLRPPTQWRGRVVGLAPTSRGRGTLDSEVLIFARAFSNAFFISGAVSDQPSNGPSNEGRRWSILFSSSPFSLIFSACAPTVPISRRFERTNHVDIARRAAEAARGACEGCCSTEAEVCQRDLRKADRRVPAEADRGGRGSQAASVRLGRSGDCGPSGRSSGVVLGAPGAAGRAQDHLEVRVAQDRAHLRHSVRTLKTDDYANPTN